MIVGRRPARRKGAWLASLLSILAVLGFCVVAISRWDAELTGKLILGAGATIGAGTTAASLQQGFDGQRRPPQLRRSDAPTRQKPGRIPAGIRQRCQGTQGDWCVKYYTQEEVAAVTAPRGNKTCSLNCNQVGVCNALSGLCTCPAGWTGFNCMWPMKRYCTHKFREFGFEVERVPANLSVGLEGQPTGPSIFQFTRSHCAGYCDEDLAACFCPSNTTYGRIPAAVDAPPGAPPQRRGRPMGEHCQPNKLPDGRQTFWGTVDPENLYGPQGWCMAAQPKQLCDCYPDGWGGSTCEEPLEQFCFNQCNGRGQCSKGYCKCDPGWHGIDCAHRSASARDDQPGREAARPWMADHVHTPAARDFAANATRKRPLIYVYELPADYGTLLLQYRYGGDNCVPRFYRTGNETLYSGSLYLLETAFLEMLLQSEHRTLDPEEADFFYVPVFPTCFIEHIRQGADSLRDMYYGVHQHRVQSSTNLLLEAYHWLRSHHPYWDRRGGRDHIWLVTFDEASCFVPAAIRSSIILSQWGRKDLNHTANTGYWEDNYSDEFRHPQWEPHGFLRKIAGHACYDPAKDLTLPCMKPPAFFHASPLAGAPARHRTWLAFHKGRVQPDNPRFSRGIRQRLAKAAKDGDWQRRHRIVVGDWEEVPGDYSENLASSVFCLVLPGDGWTARMEDATLHGCIPVIVMDDVDVSFEAALDLSSWTLRVPQADAEKLPAILEAVPQARRCEMQANLAHAWQRFTWSSWRPFVKSFQQLQQQKLAAQQPAGGAAASKSPSLPSTVTDLDPAANDAFSTVMAWLYGRIDATR